jgi:DNA polymerase-3 subunit alpha
MGSTAEQKSERSRPEAEELLWKWLRLGWEYRRVGDRPAEQREWYGDRVKYEMDLILERVLADFFLFTSDTIRWGKDNGIPFGPGRGSTAASVVAWLLRITEIDPHRYPMMVFERFLDISRPDPPDIDVDCSDEDRWRVWEYLAGKYGRECFGHIGNFVRYRGKNSLKDVARVYGIPPWAVEVVANSLIERSGGDSRFDATLKDTFEMFPAAAEILDEYPDLIKATRLEGDVRGMSVHAAGLVIANSPLTDICAIYTNKDTGAEVMSIDKYDAEYAGVLKLDFLGLSTMGMIARCLKMAGLTLEDLYAIPDTDPGAVKVFSTGDVIGVFQFEGRATRLVNRDVRPDHFMHITDVNALSRPGPLFSGQTADYVAVRHGRKQAESLHPMVDEITKDTYGQIIYQEQILRILKEMGGFDWFSVSQIRRIISKKMGEAAFQMSYEQFAQGALDAYGVPRELADRIWKRLVTSGTYSFNIAHAISYSMLAFWTAWLKANYPLEFYAASLAKAGNPETKFRLMRDALAHSIDVRPPNVRHSHVTWIPHIRTEHGEERRELLAGWNQIPKIGDKMAGRIEAARPEGGWKSYYDLTVIPGIGPKTAERMIEFAAANDPFGLYRTERKLAAVNRWLRRQREVPMPTRNGEQLASMEVVKNAASGFRFARGPAVVYMGVVRRVEYKDIVEDERSRTGREVEEILAELKRPDLIKRATLHMYDTSDEEVYGRINRWKFPYLQKKLGTIHVNHDVVVIAGFRIAGFGTPVMVERIWVIDPEG